MNNFISVFFYCKDMTKNEFCNKVLIIKFYSAINLAYGFIAIRFCTMQIV